MLPAGRDSRGLWQVDLAGVRVQFAEDDLEQSRLANAVTPHEPDSASTGSDTDGAIENRRPQPLNARLSIWSMELPRGPG